MVRDDEPMHRLAEFINSGRHQTEEIPDDIKRDVLAWNERNRPIYPKPMKPPWRYLPHIPFGSIGWRMGLGEDYWGAFCPWFLALTSDAKKVFSAKNPEPESWEGFYEMVKSRGTR